MVEKYRLRTNFSQVGSPFATETPAPRNNVKRCSSNAFLRALIGAFWSIVSPPRYANHGTLRRALKTAVIKGGPVSESWNIRERHAPGMHMHAAELGAAVQRWKHLAGVEQSLGVEGAFEPLLLVEVALGKPARHQGSFLDADTVLAGEHAADLDAELEDLGAELLGALQFARLVGIIEDQRMQVAVAGVKHIGDAQPELLGELARALQDQRQLGARNGAVHAVVVGRNAPDRRERCLAPGPEQEPFVLRRRDADLRRAALPRNRLHALQQMVHFRGRAVELDDQQGLDIERIARVDEFLDRMDRRPVHQIGR